MITETLDPNLDLSTFELGDFGFADVMIEVPAGRQTYKTRVDARSSRGVYVDVSAELVGRIATWTFESIDPATGKPPADPEAGFLPPDRNPPNGEGYVMYSARPLSGLASGPQVKAQASVVFDTNAPVATNMFINTLDTGAPTSRVTALPSPETTTSFKVSWSGTDTGGPGIASYDIFVSTDGGRFQPLLSQVTDTSTSFTGKSGHRYAFYSLARDFVGNTEKSKLSGDTSTTVETPSSAVCTGCYILTGGIRAALSFNVSGDAAADKFAYNFRTSSQTVQFVSTAISKVSVDGQTATFSGEGTLNGLTGYNFAITAKDGGGPGTGLDEISIAITGPGKFLYSVKAAIMGGDIVVK